MPRGLSSVRDATPDGVPVVCVGHAVPVDFRVVVPQVVSDALAVLVDVLVPAVSAVCVVPIVLAALVDVRVLAVLGVVDLLADVPVHAVLVDVLVLAVLGMVDVPVAVLVLGVVDLLADVLVHAVLVDVLVLAVLGAVDVPVDVLVLAVLGVVDVLVDARTRVWCDRSRRYSAPCENFTSSLTLWWR